MGFQGISSCKTIIFRGKVAVKLWEGIRLFPCLPLQITQLHTPRPTRKYLVGPLCFLERKRTTQSYSKGPPPQVVFPFSLSLMFANQRDHQSLLKEAQGLKEVRSVHTSAGDVVSSHHEEEMVSLLSVGGWLISFWFDIYQVSKNETLQDSKMDDFPKQNTIWKLIYKYSTLMFTTVFYPCKVLITAGSLIQTNLKSIVTWWLANYPKHIIKVIRWYKSHILTFTSGFCCQAR